MFEERKRVSCLMSRQQTRTTALGTAVAMVVMFQGCIQFRQSNDNSKPRKYDFLRTQQYQVFPDPPAVGLPAGGIMSTHPIHPEVKFYHTLLYLFEQKPQADPGMRGLWVSRDQGKTWLKVACGIRDFEYLFIHPQTGVMFASVSSQPFRQLDGGTLVTGSECRIVTSVDGRDWRDISPDVGHDNIYGAVFRDPDSTNRVCVYSADHLRYRSCPVFYQAKDDKYEGWRSYTYEEWSTRHIGWNWGDFYRSCSFGELLEEKGEPAAAPRRPKPTP